VALFGTRGSVGGGHTHGVVPNHQLQAAAAVEATASPGSFAAVSVRASLIVWVVSRYSIHFSFCFANFVLVSMRSLIRQAASDVGEKLADDPASHGSGSCFFFKCVRFCLA
jgi:hypothetical protein